MTRKHQLLRQRKKDRRYKLMKQWGGDWTLMKNNHVPTKITKNTSGNTPITKTTALNDAILIKQ